MNWEQCAPHSARCDRERGGKKFTHSKAIKLN